MDIRSQFPVLGRKVYGKELVYLDNAATSQRPLKVLELQERICRESNANVHRAVHALSGEATEYYEDGREAVRRFINAPGRENVILTSGTTASLNLLATCFTERYVGKGDKVVISQAEHHSNIVPWQIALSKAGASLEVIPVDERGELCMDEFRKVLDGRVKLVSVAHVSNVLGIVNPVEEIIREAHSKGIPVALDGAQGIVHQKVDVQALDCDFYAFSGHKIYAPTGIGVLYGKKTFLEEMPPYMGGGDMIDKVTFEKTTYAPLPLKYEAGTPNYVAAACFAPALDFALEAGMDDRIVPYLMDELPKIEGLHLYGNPAGRERKIPLFSFTVDGTHPSDIAQIMDKLGFALRSGHVCAEPLMDVLGVPGIVRASFAPYNTFEECCRFVEALKRVLSMLR
ncbi:MAG: SufS family cysteine desulfurase [Bacteroidales bacterium]|nr:SufS family cysteine desulfurase [Candidatus Cacconaster merdequi]